MENNSKILVVENDLQPKSISISFVFKVRHIFRYLDSNYGTDENRSLMSKKCLYLASVNIIKKTRNKNIPSLYSKYKIKVNHRHFQTSNNLQQVE